MATIIKRGGAWRVQVRRKGITKSGTFTTKAEAVAWGAQMEADILAGRRGDIPDKTFRDLLDRYAEEVSVAKRGERWERMRLALIGRDALGAVRLPALRAPDFAAWRDRRLRQVSAASVRREWTLLSHACNVAVREWHWLEENPLKAVRRPVAPPPRDRLMADSEIEAILHALGWQDGVAPATAAARTGAALLFALETGMRAGEICRLTAGDIVGQVATIREAKTRAGVRRVPLSRAAVAVLNGLPRGEAGAALFGLTPAILEASWRKARDKAGAVDLHFHDSRHTAITRLAGRLTVLELARMVGHRDLRQLMVYYNETAEALAGKLG
jgi:integrase